MGSLGESFTYPQRQPRVRSREVEQDEIVDADTRGIEPPRVRSLELQQDEIVDGNRWGIGLVITNLLPHAVEEVI